MWWSFFAYDPGFLVVVPIVAESEEPSQFWNHSNRCRGRFPIWLEREGYEVIAAKQRLPLWIQVGGNQYESRLYADYVALEGEETYVVVLAKAKRALRWSGAAIRDRFLGHVLAFQATGILNVDPIQGTLKKITFEIQGVRTPERRRGVGTSHLIMMGSGGLDRNSGPINLRADGGVVDLKRFGILVNKGKPKARVVLKELVLLLEKRGVVVCLEPEIAESIARTDLSLAGIVFRMWWRLCLYWAGMGRCWVWRDASPTPTSRFWDLILAISGFCQRRNQIVCPLR